MMKKLIRRIAKGLLLGAPLILGFVGLAVVAQQPPVHALFLSACMYVMEYQETPPNIWVEIARWTAPLVTASGVVYVFAWLRDGFVRTMIYLRGKSTAVYGPEEDKQNFLTQLKGRGIGGKDKVVRAHRYLLLYDEQTNFDFYNLNRKALAGKDVYIRCNALSAQAVANDKLHLFCLEETAARLFWKDYSLFSKSRACGHRLDVVLIGFGPLGEEVLLTALQNNVFSVDQKISYHIFGEDDGFLATHTQLDAIADPVIFHQGAWYDRLDLLEQAQMVVVLEQKDQIALLRRLLLATHREKLHVFCADGIESEYLDGKERLELFDWEDIAQTPEYIFGEKLMERAKRINHFYACRNQGARDNRMEREKFWRSLDGFTRGSNIGAADYYEVRREMMAAMGYRPGEKELRREDLELLAELEHIRWCRYHYLNNWRYGVPEDGANKDKIKRIHISLLPFHRLSEENRQTDRETVQISLEVG